MYRLQRYPGISSRMSLRPRLLAQLRHDPQSKRVDTLVGDLMKAAQTNSGWGSTYSNAWPLIALATYSESRSCEHVG